MWSPPVGFHAIGSHAGYILPPLLRLVPSQGGAYGGGAAASPLGGTFTFTSYRDPRSLETVEAFEAAAEWAAKGEAFSHRDVEVLKIVHKKGYGI
eukprot:670756-Prorocentrum_minimum.AAC.2